MSINYVLQWISDSVTDMYADAVLCVITKIAADPNRKKGTVVVCMGLSIMLEYDIAVWFMSLI